MNSMGCDPYYIVLYTLHYNGVIMTTMASQITSLTVVYSTVYKLFFRRRSKKTSKLRVTGFCVVTGTGEFPAQRASYAENVSIWWGIMVPSQGVKSLHSVFRSATHRWNPSNVRQVLLNYFEVDLKGYVNMNRRSKLYCWEPNITYESMRMVGADGSMRG